MRMSYEDLDEAPVTGKGFRFVLLFLIVVVLGIALLSNCGCTPVASTSATTQPSTQPASTQPTGAVAVETAVQQGAQVVQAVAPLIPGYGSLIGGIAGGVVLGMGALLGIQKLKGSGQTASTTEAEVGAVATEVAPLIPGAAGTIVAGIGTVATAASKS